LKEKLDEAHNTCTALEATLKEEKEKNIVYDEAKDTCLQMKTSLVEVYSVKATECALFKARLMSYEVDEPKINQVDSATLGQLQEEFTRTVAELFDPMIEKLAKILDKPVLTCKTALVLQVKTRTTLIRLLEARRKVKHEEQVQLNLVVSWI